MTDPTLLILFLITAGTQAVFVFAGWLILKYPPDSANGLYGYRTNRSMKDPQLWKAGNRFAADIMIKLGLWCIIISVVFLLITSSQTVWIFWMLASSVGIAGIAVFKTEQFLKKEDQSNQKRKKES